MVVDLEILHAGRCDGSHIPFGLEHVLDDSSKLRVAERLDAHAVSDHYELLLALVQIAKAYMPLR